MKNLIINYKLNYETKNSKVVNEVTEERKKYIKSM